MSGLEALGIACLIMQVITFARDTASVCSAIYKGQQTPDAQLEDKGHAMKQLNAEIETACSKGSTTETQELHELATKCRIAAESLLLEVEKITKHHKKSSLRSAVKASLSSLLTKPRIEALDTILRGYQELIQSIMIKNNYYRIQAMEIQQREDFKQTRSEFQLFIDKIIAGHTEIASLVAIESESTRQHHAQQIRATEYAIRTHVDLTYHREREREAAEKRHERLLKSLKAPHMNQRVNNIMDPREAEFGRVFRSFDAVTGSQVERDTREGGGDFSEPDFDTSTFESYTSDTDTSEIDSVWESFLQWLQSDERLYWISGKPGSGKSTLVKFVIQHEATTRLLGRWQSDHRILSHFFWKPGAASQNDMKGMLSSLAHQVLDSSLQSALSVLNASGSLASKDCYDDWSVRELEDVFLAAVTQQQNFFCIFIDGLDEFVDKNGPEVLLNLVRRLAGYEKLKICVASRPENRLRQSLQKLPSLRLQDLTRPDMETFVQRKFADIEVRPEYFQELTQALVDKAEGVFLWLRLVSKGIKDGIQNGDSEMFILKRLHSLPSELDHLYNEMWKRLNEDEPIYREEAARYFKLIIAARAFGFDRIGRYDRTLEGPVWGFRNGGSALIDIAGADDLAPNTLLHDAYTLTLNQAIEMCKKTEKALRIQCAGLLEVNAANPEVQGVEGFEGMEGIKNGQDLEYLMSNVDFVHRTAYDFLTTTEAGLQILHYEKSTESQIGANLLAGLLRSVPFLMRTWPCLIAAYQILNVLGDIAAKVRLEGSATTAIMALILVVEKLWEDRLLKAGTLNEFPGRPFFSLVLDKPALDDFAAPRIQQMTPKQATQVLQGYYTGEPRSMTMRMLQTLLVAGADPRAYYCRMSYAANPSTVADRRSALWDFLIVKSGIPKEGDIHNTLLLLMLSSCPGLNLDERYLLPPVIRTSFPWFQNSKIWSPFFVSDSYYNKQSLNLAMEVDLQFMLEAYVQSHASSISQLDAAQCELAAKLHAIGATGSHESYAKIRFIIDEGKIYRIPECHPIQHTFDEIVHHEISDRSPVFGRGQSDNGVSRHQFDYGADRSQESPLRLEFNAALEAISRNHDIQAVMMDKESFKSELCGQELGLCSLEEAGLQWSNELGRFVEV